MRRRTVVAAALVAVPLLTAVWWFTRPEGTRETDRVARVVADAVAYPRQGTTNNYVNAVLATQAAQGGGLTVVRAKDLGKGEGASSNSSELLIHIHRDSSQSGLITHEAVDACYRLRFTFHDGTSKRVHCPDDLTPLAPRPQDEYAELPPPMSGGPAEP